MDIEAIGSIATGTALLIGLILRGQKQASQQTSELIRALKIDSSGSSGSSGSSEASNQITVTGGSTNAPLSGHGSDTDRIIRALNSSHEDLERRLQRVEQCQSDIYTRQGELKDTIRDGISKAITAVSELGTNLLEKIAHSLAANRDNRLTVESIANKLSKDDTPVSKG